MEVVKALAGRRHILFAIVLLIPVFGMHTPASKLSMSLFAAIVVLAFEWRHIEIDAELRHILLAFIVYLLLFTALSADLKGSLKGSYDMLRGLVHFPIALLLARYARSRDVSMLLKVSVTVLLLSQFFFPRTDFFGFYLNPNNVAVTLIFLLSLSLPWPFSSDRRPAEILVGALGLVAGLYLLVLTNSRGAWLGFAVAAGVLILGSNAISTRLKTGLLALVIGALLGALYFLNWKGLELNLRGEIWEALYSDTLINRPWLGYGINYAKELIPALSVPFKTTHNIFLEVFVSSGLVGLAFMFYVFFLLYKHYRSFRFEHSGIFYSGLFGLVAFLVMDQFDLKFASYRFLGSHCFFLGLIYACRRNPVTGAAQEQGFQPK